MGNTTKAIRASLPAIAAILLVLSLIAGAMSHPAFADDGAIAPEASDSDIESAWIGTWDLIESGENGEVTNSSADFESLRSNGSEAYLELDEGGICLFMAFGDAMTGTWEAASASEGTVAFDGETIAMMVAGERLALVQGGSWMLFAKRETPDGFSGKPMHRLYNPWSGEHFYTASASERNDLIVQSWRYEGIGWTAPESSDTPVFRLYNPYAGEHHYTLTSSERDAMVMEGWVYEGIGWCSDDAESVPLYREYNPYEFANNHNYTTDAAEHEHLVSLGWIGEGIAWYGLAAPESPAPAEPSATDSTPEQPATPDPAPAEPSATDPTPSPAPEEPAAHTFQANVKVQGYDGFTVTVDEDSAPITAANFRKLVEDGYYDGLAFYRIVEGFCLQGGTKGDNAAGNDPELTPIVGEFSGNGYENPLADDFRKGVVAMARSTEPNSATSTFFITLGTSQLVSNSLNGQYAAFGTIDEAGMQIVDSICSDYIEYATGAMGAIEDPEHMPIIESITIAS